jgi:predicted CoA-binding protein
VTPTLEAKVHDFLAQKRIAIAGVSRANNHHPAANLIYHRLKETGHDVFAVNPHMQTFEGDRCYPDLQSIPGGVDGAVIITRPETTERIVRRPRHRPLQAMDRTPVPQRRTATARRFASSRASPWDSARQRD